MFLVHNLDFNAAYGEGWLGFGGLVMNMDLVMAFNGGAGRIDTIAHELGHNLGLVQPDAGRRSQAATPIVLTPIT